MGFSTTHRCSPYILQLGLSRPCHKPRYIYTCTMAQSYVLQRLHWILIFYPTRWTERDRHWRRKPLVRCLSRLINNHRQSSCFWEHVIFYPGLDDIIIWPGWDREKLMQLAVETLLDQCRSASKIWQHTYHGVNFFFLFLNLGPLLSWSYIYFTPSTITGVEKRFQLPKHTWSIDRFSTTKPSNKTKKKKNHPRGGYWDSALSYIVSSKDMIDRSIGRSINCSKQSRQTDR